MASSVLQNAHNGLCQCKTNGKSKLGSLAWAALPFFMNNNPLPDGKPWGQKTDTNTNYYTDAPDTGVTRNYDFVLSRGKLAPDGYLRDVILVNGAYPGPLIEANWGDKISVNVFNNITEEEEGTALHWHGFLQKGTGWEDGVPGITQCPIAPGKNLTYEFKADLYGTSWYHSHYSAQYSGGAEGPIVVYGPTEEKYDIDVGPIMLADWYHQPYLEIIEELLAPGATGRVFSDNNLINGRNNFDCTTKAAGDDTPCKSDAGIAKFKFQKGKTHRLRLINSGSDATQRFSLDEHTMTVIANDFVPIKPYNTTVVTLGVGQRVDVLVKADASSSKSAFWMRSNATSCSLANQPFGVAAVYYEDADPTANPTSTPWDVADPGTCANDALDLTEPLYPIALPTPDITKTMDIGIFVNETGTALWTFDGVSARVDYNDPVLPHTVAGQLNFTTEANVRDFTGNDSIRIIVNNKSPAAHPMHLHGHNFFVLDEGVGAWDGTTVVRSSNPMRRDVQMVQAQGYLVIQFNANPGVWAWHCHIAWHASAGFMATLEVDTDAVAKWKLPAKVDQTCKDWDAWTNRAVPDQIDSGI